MESVGSPEEEVKLNAPIPAPHIIPSSSSYRPLLRQVSNLSGEIILISENDDIKANKYGATETVLWDKGVKYSSYAVGSIRVHLIPESPPFMVFFSDVDYNYF